MLIPIVGLVVSVIYAYIIQHKMHELAETTYRAAAMRNAAAGRESDRAGNDQDARCRGRRAEQVGADDGLPVAHQRLDALAVGFGDQRRGDDHPDRQH